MRRVGRMGLVVAVLLAARATAQEGWRAKDVDSSWSRVAGLEPPHRLSEAKSGSWDWRTWAERGTAVQPEVAAAAPGAEKPGWPRLERGSIFFTGRDGRPARRRLRGKIDDFAVSPDGRAAAWIRVDSEMKGEPREDGPLVTKSTLFYGLAAEGFRPVRVRNEVRVDGRSWSVAQGPKLSPDLRSLYFLIPNSMTSLQLTRRPLQGSGVERIADVSDYFVVWGGPHSGDLLLLMRKDPEAAAGRDTVSYSCYWRRASGAMVEVAPDCWAEFERVSRRWCAAQGGVCR